MTNTESKRIDDISFEQDEVKRVLLSCLEISDQQAQHAAEEVIHMLLQGRIIDDEYAIVYHKLGVVGLKCT